jgi:hypothetical protein
LRNSLSSEESGAYRNSLASKLLFNPAPHERQQQKMEVGKYHNRL